MSRCASAKIFEKTGKGRLAGERVKARLDVHYPACLRE